MGELKVFRIFDGSRDWILRLHYGQPDANSLHRRNQQSLEAVIQHKQKKTPGFTHRYNVTRLVYFEQYSGIGLAIMREKQLKGLLRKKKISLIESKNPEWKDLSDGYIAGHLLKAAN